MEKVYLITFFAGVGFVVALALIGGVMGGFGHGDAGGDVGGADVGGAHVGHVDVGGADVGGLDVGHVDVGHAHADAGGHHGFSIGQFFSPMTVAAFCTGFGGVGYLTHKLLGSLSVLPAMAGGLAFAAGVWGSFRFLYRFQADITPRPEDLIGLEAKVITSIPADGLGEVSYMVKGALSNSPARSEEAKEIPRHASVRITRVVGRTVYVRELPEEKLRKLPG